MGSWLLFVEDFQIFKVISFRLLGLSCSCLSFDFYGSILVFLHLIRQTGLFRRLGWLWHVEFLDLGFGIRWLHRWLLVCSKFFEIEFLDYVGCGKSEPIACRIEQCVIRCRTAVAAANDLRVAGAELRAARASRALCAIEVSLYPYA
jgi:hypothetical protein